MLKNFPLLLILLVIGSALTAIGIAAPLPDLPAIALLLAGVVLNIWSVVGLLIYLFRKAA